MILCRSKHPVGAIAFSLLILLAGQVTAQTKLNFDSLIVANVATFKGSGQFAGKGWDQLVENASKTNYVLIGEDHFISEVPLFTQALIQRLDVDNYVCEMDQWMLNIFASKINTLPESQLNKWISVNNNGFSFFQKKNEFALLHYLVKQKVKLIGIEQVGLMSTTILLQYLVETGSQKNRKWYQVMRDSSDVSNNNFFRDQNKPFFLSTAFFSETIAKLDRASMKADEAGLIDAMVRSAEIYKTGSHRNRIKLMQSNLMMNYPTPMKGKKNVFKFGANHSMKGESYLPVYDIGTTAHILAQSENKDSYHILVLPKSGKQAGFLGGTNSIDLNDDGLYHSLKPFFERSSDSDWTFIDLAKVRNAVSKYGFSLNNSFLEKSIKGYDALVVIPVASAAEPLK